MESVEIYDVFAKLGRLSEVEESMAWQNRSWIIGLLCRSPCYTRYTRNWWHSIYQRIRAWHSTWINEEWTHCCLWYSITCIQLNPMFLNNVSWTHSMLIYSTHNRCRSGSFTFHRNYSKATIRYIAWLNISDIWMETVAKSQLLFMNSWFNSIQHETDQNNIDIGHV